MTSPTEKRVYLASNGKTLLCRGCNQKALSENDSYHDICMKRVSSSAESRAWLDDRTFAAMWLIGHANMLVFVLGMVRVLR